MKKIAVVVFHFGPAPWFLPFFLKSCTTNDSIDFLFFTDLPPQENDAANVKYIPFTLQAFNELATEQLNMPIAAEKAYKLCDFRPAFGVIFSPYLQEYDWWGYADTDVIFGRIREFLTPALLDEYHVICVKDKYPAGFFTMLKNTPAVNHLFAKSKDYKEIFLSQQNHMFDECGGAYHGVEHGVNILEMGMRWESFQHVLVKEQPAIRCFYDYWVAEDIPGGMQWNNGVLVNSAMYEVLLYHLSAYKTNQFSLRKRWKKVPAVYFIDKYNIRPAVFYSPLIYWFTEKFRPSAILLYRRIVMKLAARFKSTGINYLETGDYYYMQQKITVARTPSNNNYLQLPNGKRRILRMPFSRNSFFLPTGNMLFRKQGDCICEMLSNGNVLRYSPADKAMAKLSKA